MIFKPLVAKPTDTKGKANVPGVSQCQRANLQAKLDGTVEIFMEDDNKRSSVATKNKVMELLCSHPRGVARDLIPEKYQARFDRPLIFQDVRCNHLEELCSKLSKKHIIELRYDDQGKLFVYPTKTFLNKYKKEQKEKKLAETNIPKMLEMKKTVNFPPNVIMPDEDIPLEKWEKYEQSGFVELYISQVERPSTFYVQVRSRGSDLDELMNEMEKYYMENSEKLKINGLVKGLLGMQVAALFGEQNGYLHQKPVNQGWHRAKVLKILGYTVKVLYIDYGTIREIDIYYLRFLHKKFTLLPAQALRATLAGVIPRQLSNDPGEQSKKWTRSSTERFFLAVNATNDISLPVRGVVGQIVKKPWKNHNELETKISIPVILYDTVTNPIPGGININDVMIKEGYADIDTNYLTSNGCLPWEFTGKKAILDENKKVGHFKDMDAMTQSLIPSQEETLQGYNPRRKEVEDERELEPLASDMHKAREKVEEWLLKYALEV